MALSSKQELFDRAMASEKAVREHVLNNQETEGVEILFETGWEVDWQFDRDNRAIEEIVDEEFSADEREVDPG